MSDLKLLTPADLEALVDTARELTAEVNLAGLLESILDRAARLIDATDGAVLLYDPRLDGLFFAHATGTGAATVLGRWGEQSQERIPLASSKAGAVYRTGEAMVVNAMAPGGASHFIGVDRETRTSTDSLVCVPLTWMTGRIGVVQIRNKHKGEFTDRDRVLLQCFADQAAVAVRNARLFEDLLAHMGLWRTRDAATGPVELLRELDAPARLEMLSVMFADMRAFTQLSQLEARPERTQQMLNEFLGMLADSVIAHEGIVNKFMGDGVMALFRGPDHASRALRSGAAMIEAFPRLRQQWDDLSHASLDFLDIGVGISTDLVILGSVGGNRVRDFTAIGTAVIRASHLADAAREGRRLLVDKGTFRAVRALVGDVIGPEVVELRKPSQPIGLPYDRYEICQLKAGPRLSGKAVEAASPKVPPRQKTVFISYSHKDKVWLDILQEHLAPYVRNGLVNEWSDARISAGARWKEEIARSLADARVAILLVSPHFLSSSFIATSELPPLLAGAKADGVTILWVPVSASSYDVTEISTFQALHDPAQPLDTLSKAEQNRVFVGVCKQIQIAAGSS